MSPVRHCTVGANKGMSNGMRVLAVAGSSAGHIFPALSFLDTLKNRGVEIEAILVMPSRTIKSLIIPDNFRVKYISTPALKLNLEFKNAIAILGFIRGALESLSLLVKFRPDIVVGFGGLDSVPLLVFAWLARIKTLIHEQNVIPGRANRLLAKFTDRIAVSFIETKNYLKISPEKIVFTGNPIRQELIRIEKARALSFFGFDDDKFTILVMGGSQGSHKINTAFLGAVSLMADRSGFQVIHIAGLKDRDLLNKSYEELDIKYKLFGFLKEIQYAYSISDLVISRAGATTITELISFSLAAIIIPYPFAYGHQLANAKVLENKGCAVVIEDDDLDAGKLKRVLDELMNKPDKMKLMRSHYTGVIKPNAADLLVDELLSFD